MRSKLFALSLTLIASVAFAADQSPVEAARPRAACKADVTALCPGVQPGGGRVAACLKQNEAQVSEACRSAMANAHQKRIPQAPTQASPQI
jgi:hypothetical protein